MNLFERNMTYLIKELKENHGVLGLKAEFGEEGSSYEEVSMLKKIADYSKIDMTLKIGGCEAVRDLFDAKKLGIKTIVVPMVESTYAAKKFIECVFEVFRGKDLYDLKLYINIETPAGYNALDGILKLAFAHSFNGIVFGRTDFACSLDMSKSEVDNDIIFDYAQNTAKLVSDKGKEFIIGGGVSPSSMPFFERLSNVSKIETRNIIFSAKNLISDNKANYAITKAVEFEIMKLKNRKNIFGELPERDRKRMQILENRLGKSIIKPDFCKTL